MIAIRSLSALTSLEFVRALRAWPAIVSTALFPAAFLIGLPLVHSRGEVATASRPGITIAISPTSLTLSPGSVPPRICATVRWSSGVPALHVGVRLIVGAAITPIVRANAEGKACTTISLPSSPGIYVITASPVGEPLVQAVPASLTIRNELSSMGPQSTLIGPPKPPGGVAESMTGLSTGDDFYSILLPFFVLLSSVLVPLMFVLQNLYRDPQSRSVIAILAMPVSTAEWLLSKTLVGIAVGLLIVMPMAVLDTVLYAGPLDATYFPGGLLLLAIGGMVFSTSLIALVARMARDARTASNLSAAMLIPAVGAGILGIGGAPSSAHLILVAALATVIGAVLLACTAYTSKPERLVSV